MPYDLFPIVTESLTALESGNGTLLYSIFRDSPFECDCSTNDIALNSNEAIIAVQCSDAEEVTDCIEQFTAFVKNAAKTSQFAEFLVDDLRVNCEYVCYFRLVIAMLILLMVGKSIGRVGSWVQLLQHIRRSRS
jgi:hypothetical protein